MPEEPNVMAAHRLPKKVTRRRLLVTAGALGMAVGLFAGIQTYRAVTSDDARAAYDAALTELTATQLIASNALRADERTLTSASAMLDSSVGKVEEELRTTLAAAIANATTRVNALNQTVSAARNALDSPRAMDDSYFAPGSGLRADTVIFHSFDALASENTRTVTADLAVPVQAVVAALEQWQSERDRVLADRYTNNVAATGWYPELDQCTGSVDITARYQGVPTIAEHWSCGGKLFPDDAGTIIALTGVHEGTYRVEGIVAMLNSSRNTPSDLPRGYDLLYQTCQNGQSSTMSFTALTKIVE